jgi:hypothetical protein
MRNSLTIATGIILLYVFIYPPFFYSEIIISNTRITIEFIVGIMLIILILRRGNISINLTINIGLIVLITLILIMFGGTKIINNLSLLSKLIFMVLLTEIIWRNKLFRNNLISVWIKITYITVIICITSFLCYNLRLIEYDHYQLNIERYYLYNPFLGNIGLINFFGFKLGRVYFVFYESIYLGFLFALNITMSKNWIELKRPRQFFIILNIIGGITTLSSAFFIFLLFYYIFSNVKRININIIIKLITILFICYLLWHTNYISGTSYLYRTNRLIESLNLYINSDILIHIFGSGIGITIEKLGFGLDGIWMALLIERGALVLFIVMFLFFRNIKTNNSALVTILYYGFAVNFLMYPIIYFLFSLSVPVYSTIKMNERY